MPLINATKYTGINGGSPTPIDTTGAKLLVYSISISTGFLFSPAVESFTLVDNLANPAHTSLTPQFAPTGNQSLLIAYVPNPTVGAGHTFTIGPSSIFVTIILAAFSGIEIVSPFDDESGANGAGPTLASGAVVPSTNGQLIVTAVSTATNGVDPTVDSGFTMIDKNGLGSGDHYGGGLAYLEQAVIASINPTWNAGGADGMAAASATFKMTAGGGGGGAGKPDHYYRMMRGM